MATVFTVKAGGGGDFTTIQACATAMAAGDTCTVFAGTYAETPTLTAGTVGNYKTITVDGSDVVTVRGFIAASHVKIVGNCTAPAAAGSCGFTVQFPTSPTNGGCISIPVGTTDLYIRNNVITQCGVSSQAMIDSGSNTATFIYIQGNTLSYPCANSATGTSATSLTIGTGSQTLTTGTGLGFINGQTVRLSSQTVNATNNMTGTITSYTSGTGAMVVNVTSVAGSGTFSSWQVTPVVCVGMLFESGDHYLIENNDISHFTLGIDWTTSYTFIRNNTFHDSNETEGTGNQHTDAIFSEPGITTPVQFNVYEGNYQYNGFGVDAKGMLTQTDGCGGDCFNMIERYNHANRIGGAMVTNNTGPAPVGWPNLKAYNNTWYDTNTDANFAGSCSNPPIGDNSQYAQNASLLNNIYYYTNSGMTSSACFNPYACGSNSQVCSFGYSLLFCTAGCIAFNGTSGAFSHTYQSGAFTSDTGNVISNPNFVNPGSDYNLQAGSPAIATGIYLTTANGSGTTSTSLVVTDASYFQDGYGLTNAYSTVSGDCISITTVGNHVCITAINYSTNTLTLASPMSWTTGDHIWLYSKSDGTRVLTGIAPDMGAFPFTGALGNAGSMLPGATLLQGATILQ